MMGKEKINEAKSAEIQNPFLRPPDGTPSVAEGGSSSEAKSPSQQDAPSASNKKMVEAPDLL